MGWRPEGWVISTRVKGEVAMRKLSEKELKNVRGGTQPPGQKGYEGQPGNQGGGGGSKGQNGYEGQPGNQSHN